MKNRKPAKASRAVPPRFAECVGCEFFSPGNQRRQCRGCDAGENFEPYVDDLDPDTDTLFGEGRGQDDE